MRAQSLLLVLLAGSGCQGPAPTPDASSLVQEMKARGISDLTTQKLVIRDSEAGYGADVRVVATEYFLIQEIWDCIYASRPATRWAASGFREVDFFDRVEADRPVVTLCVNETGKAHFKGDPIDSGFRCPGLTPYLERLLEHQHRQGS